MSEPKPLASLSPTLLARKGGARPAMRTQWQQLGSDSQAAAGPCADHDCEDLGWNDMGEAEPPAAPETDHDGAKVVPFGAPDEVLVQAPLTGGVPAVVRQQDALADHLDGDRAGEGSPLIPLAAHRFAREAAGKAKVERHSALAAGRRAAFTLRVDEVRHFKLRLACTMQGRSAQQLVTQALDRLLGELPELDNLAKRVRRR